MSTTNLESRDHTTLSGLVYELRPWQWYKQLILYLAVVFSGSADELSAWIRVTAGAVLFSAVAGGTYILNDVADVEADRNHPRKRHRPIASGQLSIPLAIVVAIGLYAVSGVLSWTLDLLFFGLLSFYVGQNVVYSAWFKRYLFVDLLSISVGFVVRAIAGVVLVGVQLSPWILLCTFLTALLLGVSKRIGERTDGAGADAADIRSNLEGYSPRLLEFCFASVATLLLMSYSLYTFFARSIAMMLTIPFAYYAVFRFAHLTFATEGDSEPVRLLLDRPLVADVALWTLTALFVLYGPSGGVWP